MAARARGEDRGSSARELNAALAIVQAVAPENELEAALAVQMAQNHALSAEMMGRAKQASDVERMQAYGNLATKLQRTFVAQIEALAKLRGKGQQTVRVEHVTVQPGAQAIVGDVHHHGAPALPGAPNATAISAASRAALPSPDPIGNGVPVPCNEKRPLSHARREKHGAAAGKPKRAEARPLHEGGDR